MVATGNYRKCSVNLSCLYHFASYTNSFFLLFFYNLTFSNIHVESKVTSVMTPREQLRKMTALGEQGALDEKHWYRLVNGMSAGGEEGNWLISTTQLQLHVLFVFFDLGYNFSWHNLARLWSLWKRVTLTLQPRLLCIDLSIDTCSLCSFYNQGRFGVLQPDLPPCDMCLYFSCRAEAEAGADNEEPDGYGSTDPRPGPAEITGGPTTVWTSLHGEVCT